MMRREPLLILVFAVCVCVSSAARGSTRIVVNVGAHPSARVAGRSEAEVNWLDADTTDDTVCTECFAALELQHYLRKMTGKSDDFVIVDDDGTPEGDLVLVGGPSSNAASKRLAPMVGVGSKQLAELGPEDYRLISVNGGRRITLVAGGGGAGTLYGAYDLLYRLGCRWFAPGETHEETPPITEISDLDVSEQPSFHTRGFHAWEDRADPQFLIWMARNRLNYWCVEQSNHPLLHKLGIQMSCAEHTAQSYFLDPASPYPYDHPQFQADNDKPGDPYPASDQYQGDVDSDGEVSYFEAHPEWYALVNDERVPGVRGGFGVNYCTSNQHATAEFMKNFVQSLLDGRYRDAGVVRFWTLDGGRWCQCQECTALGSPTDRNLLLTHRLGQGIKKARAEGRISRPIIVRFLAYADVLESPSRPLPREFDYDTCSATFFPISRCYVHNFDDPNCGANSRYRQQLHGWATDPDRHYKGQLCIGEYYNISGYRCLPIVFMHTMINDIPYYYRTGARHFHYMHVTTGNWGNKALTNYQMARQIWDVDTDCDALWKDYFAGRYGPQAETMRRFYRSLEKMWSNCTELKYGLARRLEQGATDLFPNSHLRYERQAGVECEGPTLLEIVSHAETCRKLIDQALAAELPPRIEARVSEDERMFTYGERTLEYFRACVETSRRISAGEFDEARGSLAEAKRAAEQLRDDTTSATLTYHPWSSDALEASYAAGAVVRIEQKLRLTDPANVKRFNPRDQPLVLAGSDFLGGGAVKYGYHLHVFPERKKISAQGNYVYARPTNVYSRMTARFRLDGPPQGPFSMRWAGLCYPVLGESDVPAKIILNGQPVYQGSAPFGGEALTTHDVNLPPGALREGDNEITIANTAPIGAVGSRPWFGIDRVEFRAARKNPD